MIKLSIIIPIYNPEEKVLVSLKNFMFNHNYDNVEFIVIDDGSDICCKEKIEELKINSTVKVITQANGGPGLARNKGIASASGEYIWFMDDDDEVSNGFIDNILLRISDKPDLIITNFKVLESGNLNKQEFNKLKFQDNLKGFENILFTNYYSRFGNGFLWNKIYKRSLINLFLIEFSSVRFKEDLLFNLHYSKYVKSIVYLENIFYIYNIHDNGNSYSKYNQDRLNNVIYVNESVLQQIKNSQYTELKLICEKIYLEDLFYALLLSFKYSNNFKRDFKLACQYFRNKKVKYSYSTVSVLALLLKSKCLVGTIIFYKLYNMRYTILNFNTGKAKITKSNS